jgi:hypothetical protein
MLAEILGDLDESFGYKLPISYILNLGEIHRDQF